jgi:hypothetical protein
MFRSSISQPSLALSYNIHASDGGKRKRRRLPRYGGRETVDIEPDSGSASKISVTKTVNASKAFHRLV